MPVSPTGPVTSVDAALAAAAATKAAAPTDSLGKDAFLKLLVAQLKYQDPSNPTDSSQFMTQTAQFTQVEKLDEIAKASTQMLAAQTLFATSGLVGRTVTYTGTDGLPATGVVSAASFGPGGAVLRVGPGGTEVAVGSVTDVRQTPPTPTPTAPATAPAAAAS